MCTIFSVKAEGLYTIRFQDNSMRHGILPSDCVKAPFFVDIGAEAFAWCCLLEQVNLRQCRKIGGGAFKHSGLTDVWTSAKLRPSAFESCYNLSYLTLPCQMRIPPHCFKNCSSLRQLRMRASEFGCYAFSGCELARIDLCLQSPCTIGPYAFSKTMLGM